METPVDLRSDTVTRPSAAMLEAMASAQVADDVLEGDPTTIRLETMMAELLGKEAALFVTSGTMANQLAIRLHCGRDQRFACESKCHLYNYEQGGYAQLSGVSCLTIEAPRGLMTVEKLLNSLQAEDDHYASTSMWALENTHNMAGGVVYPLEQVQEIGQAARDHNIAMHLDGARFFNAAVASGHTPQELAADFDTISVCFSKGLGAPVGSALVGSRGMIRTARRARKMFGGGMRQSGVLAAAAIWAIENNVKRLKEDHDAAKQLADTIQATQGLMLVETPETNIVICEVCETLGTAKEVCEKIQESVLALAVSERRIRFVTHMDASTAIDRACQALKRLS